MTIVPRGQALGVTYQRPESDRYNYSEEYLRARIIGILGGRSAEEVVFGSRTTGAENDIEQATNLARGMVTRWGMSDRLGMIQLAPKINPYLANQAVPMEPNHSAITPPARSTTRYCVSSTTATMRPDVCYVNTGLNSMRSPKRFWNKKL